MHIVVGYTHWCPVPPAAFAWQIWTLCTGKGSDIHPGVPWSPPRLRPRRGIISISQGLDTRPGVPWFPLLVYNRYGTIFTVKGADMGPVSLGLRLFFK